MNSFHINPKSQAIYIIILFKDFSLIIDFYEKKSIYFTFFNDIFCYIYNLILLQ